MNLSDELIVTFDYEGNDDAVLIVFRKIFVNQSETKLEVINKFTDDAAISIYNHLTTKS